MATYKLQQFSRLDVLKRLNPENLVRFLTPFKKFFAEQGLKLPRPGSRRIDYDHLIGILLSPAGDLPMELVEALYFVDDLSHPAGQERLLSVLPGLDYVWKDSPADVAVKAWLLDPEIVEQMHAERTVAKRARTYESFLVPVRSPRNWAIPERNVVESIERELESWFLSRKRGRGTRVFPMDRTHGFGFLVRHGEAFRREGALKKGKSTSVVYRPEKYDVLEFDPAAGEVRIHARSDVDKIMYRDIFARHLLGKDEAFSEKGKYTLEPLKRYGRSALACHDVPGVAWVRLVEIEWGDHRFPREFVRYRCEDLLESFELDGREIPSYADILSAKFEVRFTHIRHTRRVTIIPPNISMLTRDSDGALVEQWLYLRGFINFGVADENSTFLESA